MAAEGEETEEQRLEGAMDKAMADNDGECATEEFAERLLLPHRPIRKILVPTNFTPLSLEPLWVGDGVGPGE